MNIIELHAEAWKRLQARRAQLPHALLLTGHRGIGKFDLARLFAAALLCEQVSPAGTACGQCPACNWLGQGNHPDFRLLQPEALAEEGGEPDEDSAPKSEPKAGKKASQQITIDQVRALDDFLHVGTHRQGLRVVLIHPAEAMNRATANSLLKSLEEPLPSTLFLLVSSEADRLLPTIRSRCQVMPLPLPSPALAAAWLKAAKVDTPERWLALAGGSPLLAVALSESGERGLLEAIVLQMAQGPRLDALAAAATVDKLVKADKAGQPLKRLMEWAQKWLFDLSLAGNGLPPRYFIAETKRLQQLAARTEVRRALAFGRKTLQFKAECEQPLNSRLFLETFFMEYAALFTRAATP